MEEEVLSAIVEVKRSGGIAVLITVIATEGSTPRKAGSKMLVYPDGRTVGTIGGGCGEAEAKRQALCVFDVKRPGLQKVVMYNNIAADEGMVCGGVMELFMQFI